jgi:hypothetical protein
MPSPTEPSPATVVTRKGMRPERQKVGHIMRLPSSEKTDGGLFVQVDSVIPLVIRQLLKIREFLAEPGRWCQGANRSGDAYCIAEAT